MSMEVLPLWRADGARPGVFRHMAILAPLSQFRIGSVLPLLIRVLHGRSGGKRVRKIVTNRAEFGALQELGDHGEMVGIRGIGVGAILDRGIYLSRIEVDS